MTSHLGSMLVGVSALALAAGCGHDQPPPRAPEAQTTITQASPTKAKTDQTVSLSGDIQRACGIDDTDKAPKFDFDSTTLAGNDRDVLQKLAGCLSTGPLRGRAIRLVGRADPRGESEYNMNLGASRATAVIQYLRGLGVPEAKMGETSRGALDARGHDEPTWRLDRRVDVELSDAR